MNECGESSPKRMKISSEHNLGALNLTISQFYRTSKKTNEESADDGKFLQSNILEMKSKFQQWVLETYRDASKTKTITSKKYERIVKTLRGEIKNCAENSKFRFWMKCKGFKLETEGDIRTLYVLDKKDDSIRYKKVAIVENFFDIIYDVHVNEGARGIQHAGQKRTHKSITETYAFLPREAVTKFLLCCIDCQKRITEERKNSPLASSSSSHDSTLQTTAINDNSNSLNELSNKPITQDRNIFECYPASKAEPREHNSTHVSTDLKTYENNNNIFNEIKDCIVTPNVSINFNANLNDSITVQNTRPAITSTADGNDDFNPHRLTIRKRKRKFTRKIVRPRITNVDQCDSTYGVANAADFITSTPRQNCDIEANFVGHRIESTNDSLIQNIHPSNEQNIEFFSEKFPFDGKFPFAENIPPFEATENNPTQCTDEAAADEKKSNYNIPTKFCPYLTKISEIIFNPVKYAVSSRRKNFASVSNEEDFLEQQAVNLILKAQELGTVDGKLTENEKQQISQKVYNFRIVSFLLNYAADLMLRSLNRKI